MKRSIYRSLQAELIIYAVISLVLAIITEFAIGLVLSIIANTFGVSRHGYENKAPASKVYPPKSSIPDYHKIRHWNKDTLVFVVSVILVIGFILFILYFLLLTRRITRDMGNISNCILNIAAGEMGLRITGIKRDDEIGEIVSQVNHMSDEIERLMKSEREALQANKDMIACVAHDLRTPLTSIIGYLQLAANTKKYTAEERQRYTEIAMRKANRMQGLIEELFSYTKLMSGEISLHRSNIDIVKLVEQMIEEFYPLFMENNLEYSLKQNVYSLFMNVDSELIARAVSNLISNAVKYGKDGKAVYIELEKYDSELQIRVTNFGLVIPEENLEHIFDKFYRVESSRSSSTGGTGLGLNIAQEIAVLHGGRIIAKSGMGGTCFTIALPISDSGISSDMSSSVKENNQLNKIPTKEKQIRNRESGKRDEKQ